MRNAIQLCLAANNILHMSKGNRAFLPIGKTNTKKCLRYFVWVQIHALLFFANFAYGNITSTVNIQDTLVSLRWAMHSFQRARQTWQFLDIVRTYIVLIIIHYHDIKWLLTKWIVLYWKWKHTITHHSRPIWLCKVFSPDNIIDGKLALNKKGQQKNVK